jgi:hypothetical protein
MALRVGRLLAFCALAMLLALPVAEARSRGRSSHFVMTPNGPIPKSVFYGPGAFPSPEAYAAQVKAEQTEYEAALKKTNPEQYKKYMEWKKAQQPSTSAAKKK